MSFRQFGGLQYASKHNAVASNYNTSNNLLVTQNVGQSNSYINFLSDISGNINIYGNLDISGNIDVSGDVDISGNLHVQGNIDCSGNGSFDNSIYIYDGSSYSVISENGTTLNLVNYSNGNTNINPSGQTGITVNSSGQVGIKNTSPSYTLDVSGNANITLSNASNTNPNLTLSGGGSAVGGAYLQLLGSGTAGENVGINFDTFSDTSSGRAGGPATTIRSVDNGDYSGNLEFLTANTGSSSNLQSVSMIIKPQGSGNAFVGIGTATPGYSLDVVGNLRTTMDASINTLTVGKGGGNVATNTAVGLSALSVNTTGGYNTAIGSNALMQNIDGQYHTAIGYNSGNNNTTGLCNTFLGYLTGISGNYDNSTAIGYNSIINASNQIVLGGAADNDGGYYPSVKIPGSYVGIGGIYNPSSGYALDISGNARIALGPSATNLNPALTLSGGVSGVSGAYLQFIGGGAEDANVGINLDTFSGRTGGPATTIRSIDNGGYSGNLEFLTANSNTSSSSSVQAVSMVIKPQASGNAFVGIGTNNPQGTLDVIGNLITTADASINSITVGRGGGNSSFNTAVGLSALSVNTTGGYNTAIGSNALMQNIDGQYHTAIGYNSGNNNTTGLCNTFLGYLTGISGNYDNSTAIGYNSIINASNQIVLGGAADNDGGYYPSVKIPGSYVGIGGIYNPSSGYALDISGNARIALGPSATNLNPALTLSGGVSGVSGAYLQFIGGGAEDANVGINLDTFSGRTGGPATTIRSIDNGGYSGNLEFLTANSNTSSSSSVQAVSMIIKPQATGNAFVGIGTNSPAYTLDVSGILQVQDGTFDPMFITTLHGLNVSASNFYYNPKTPTNINSFKIELDGANCLIYKGTPNPFSYQDASATVIQNDGGNGGIALVSTSTYIYVNKNGSTPGVGIMTSNPQYTLDVSGNINFTGSLLEDGAPFSGTTQWTTYGLNIYYNTGTVGIGTASPNTTYKLDVNGKVNATLYNSTSDYRIKENVTQLDSTFVVDNLNPVTYLNNKLGKQDIGLIAHELQEIYPELVNGEKDGEQFQSVNYLGLIPILIKEIKELKKEIKSVKTELNELKNK